MKFDFKVECEFLFYNDLLLKKKQNYKVDFIRYLKVIGFIVFDIEFYFAIIFRDCFE